MLKKIIILLLITTISTKTNLVSSKIGFDVKQPFDESNHEFTFSNEAQEAKFFIAEIITPTKMLKYDYQCQGSSQKAGSVAINPRFIIKAQTGECSLNIYSSSSLYKVTGTVEVHPLDRPVPINLDKQKIAIDSIVSFNEKFPSLFYTISNLVADTEAKFTHDSPTVIIEDIYFTLKNPFRICVENECKDDIKTYTFIKGKNYTIEIKNEELVAKTKTQYCMTSFSFYKTSGGGDVGDDTSAGNNISVNQLILFLLLILIFNGLFN